jgi:hypothetical protein
VDDRDGRPPVPLPGDEPVPEPVGGRGLDLVVVLADTLAGGGAREAVVLAAFGQHPLAGERVGGQRVRALDGLDDLLDGKVLFPCEGVVALVVRGDAHHRARPHVVEDVAGDVDG